LKERDHSLTTDNLDPARRSSHEVYRLVRILSEQFHIRSSHQAPYSRNDLTQGIRAIYESLRTHQISQFARARTEVEVILRYHAPTATDNTINRGINNIVIELERFVSYRERPLPAIVRQTILLQRLIRQQQARNRIRPTLWSIRNLQAIFRARTVRARIQPLIVQYRQAIIRLQQFFRTRRSNQGIINIQQAILGALQQHRQQQQTAAQYIWQQYQIVRSNRRIRNLVQNIVIQRQQRRVAATRIQQIVRGNQARQQFQIALIRRRNHQRLARQQIRQFQRRVIQVQSYARRFIHQRRYQAHMAQQNPVNLIAALVGALQAQNLNMGPPRETNIVKISIYDGTTDPTTWLEDFESAATANNLTQARKLQVAPAYLKGIAEAWYRDRQLNPRTATTHWEIVIPNNAIVNPANTFKQPFLERFRTATKIAAWQRELDSCTQQTGETVDAYATRIRRLMRRVDPMNQNLEQTRVSAFMRGLNGACAFFVRAQNPEDVETAIDIAKGYEASFQNTAGLNFLQPLAPTTAPATTPVATTTANTNPTQHLTTLLTDMQSQITALRVETDWRRNNPQDRSPSARGPRPASRCSQCNRIGHDAQYCRERNLNYNNNNRDNRNCFKCGRVGHIARDCRTGQNRNNQNQDRRNQNWRNPNDRTYRFNEEELKDFIGNTVRHLKD
jgi:hypothetical protein